MSDLEKKLEELEDLIKGPNYWKNKDPKKYRAMLNKLKAQRKTPGHKERAQQQVLQAKRRERGGSGTTAGQNGNKGHSSGKMKTKHSTAVKRFQSSEKKAGTKLSPDRKDNNKGYGDGNVRNIPQKLNRGRHKADESKVTKWRKKLKKFNISPENFLTLLRAKALEIHNEELYKTLSLSDMENVLETLEKWTRNQKTGKMEPEPGDEGTTNPERHTLVGHRATNGRVVMVPNRNIAAERDRQFNISLGRYKNKSNQYNSDENFSQLFDELVDHVNGKLVKKVKTKKINGEKQKVEYMSREGGHDRHVRASGTTHNWESHEHHPSFDNRKDTYNQQKITPSGFTELRQRHLQNALDNHHVHFDKDSGTMHIYASERHGGEGDGGTHWEISRHPEKGLQIKSTNVSARMSHGGRVLTEGYLKDDFNTAKARFQQRKREKLTQPHANAAENKLAEIKAKTASPNTADISTSTGPTEGIKMIKTVSQVENDLMKMLKLLTDSE